MKERMVRMKKGMKILLCFLLLAIVGYGVLAIMNRPISKEAVDHKIEEHLAKVVQKNDSLSSVLLTIYSKQTGYYEQFAVGTMNQTSSQHVQTDSPFHSASIGKTMCAVIYGMLVEEGEISFNDNISKWLGSDILDGLFVADGIDYSSNVTIKHLLSHTSGAADYFVGPVTSGVPMLDTIFSNPDILFTPTDLIAFSRENQASVGQPGQQFNYSDTGYILLGLILEAIEGKPYSEILEDRIFIPLNMKNSYLMFYEDEPTEIVALYANGMDLSRRNALSVDWAGGGIVSTMNDLLTFIRALEEGVLLSNNVYLQMTDFNQRYEKGIYYGLGMMYFDFSELSFLLGSMTDLYGGVGATGSYMLYDKKKDTYFIANFGSLDFAEKGIEELVKIRMIYDRMKVE